MPRWKSSLLLLLLVAVSLAQTGTPLTNPAVRRIGDKLMCLCGCGSTITGCNMLSCHFSEPARQQILDMVNAGKSDSEIINTFVKEYGKVILAKPPAEGFDLLAWIMPFVGLAFGTLVVWWVIRRFLQPRAVSSPEIAPEEFDRYRDRIENDLSKLD